jgi:hypothetical protein
VATYIKSARREPTTVPTPNCCNCKLAKEETPHPSTYRGYKAAKEEMLRKKSLQTTDKTSTGRIFSKHTTPDISLQHTAAAGPPRPDNTT